MNAAIAVEAAAALGKFEQMYARMYEAQSEWGEQQESKAATSRESASDLGLDLTAYDKAVSDPATAARLERDRADGIERGVQGTPTLFLTGRELTLTSLEDLEAQVAAAVTAAT